MLYSGINSCSDRGCNSGHLAQGWGSGSADFPYLIDVSLRANAIKQSPILI